jgi:hypothetical protein
MEIPNFRASELALGFHCKKQIRTKFVFALPEGGMLRLALKRRMELLSDPRRTGRFLQKICGRRILIRSQSESRSRKKSSNQNQCCRSAYKRDGGVRKRFIQSTVVAVFTALGRCKAYGVRRVAYDVWRTTCGVRRTVYGVQ